ncbi:putative aldo-keto reductase family 1, member B4 [Monocercomonoides exilis]|uniref:putative aldo-keto reductase family 1, member B4 n=1 Tax=Monocercomonoides exilis TaxID=2049356 RepID=UPI003559A1B4|nr:putative aldo-keto reductase family 1, member B4 [Monocercomonoides exilis]|eukprot:MONOS_10237.1-p1 / transcript=MONOS_10237.1 / gene=MONOS_10237 / organism=Monocercomonoides_exilis_PA203 / gene_product=aldo-keto reductase family 1, member B4 / transcript_product=aldo-keto reductase family 1, member B4 / location=Mono_scaffold00457:21919-22973(+) / protein_length=316 / sequence_SO=supercontig / SO=protein_coding / is_pseudo=false
MESFTLNTGAKIPRIGLGTYKSAPGEIKRAIQSAVKAGYRHFDLAAFYGNESEIGDAFAELFASGTIKREDIFVTSKLWNTEHRAERVRPACEKTLKDTKLGYLDLYLMHWPVAVNPDPTASSDGKLAFDRVPVEVTWRAMEELVDAKLVKAIGVSNFPCGMLFNLLCGCRIRPCMNQVESHPFLQQKQLIKFCHEQGIAVTAFCPICRPGASAQSSSSSSSQSTQQLDITTHPTILRISDAHKKSPSQVVLRWHLQRAPNLCIIPKSVTPSRIEENISVYDFELSDAEMKEMEALDCGYRLCPTLRLYGLPIFEA